MTHVIVPDYPTRLQFTVGATPTTGPWAFNFTFFATSDIDVYFGSVLMTESTHYTVTGNPGREGGFEGGLVVAIAAIANTTVTIMRVLPLERVSDFPVAGSFNRQTLNSTLDKHVAMIQQIDERVDRAWSSSPTAPISPMVAYYYPRVDGSAMGLEFVPPAQVRSDIQAQPLDPTLTALAGLATSADKLVYATGPDAFALATLTAYARTILDDLDAIAMRATLGLGTMATQNANAVNITGGTISGVAVAVPGLGTMSTQNANAVAISGGTITGMPVPSGFTDVATKQYADALAFGVSKRSTVRVSSTVPVTLSTIINGATIDAVVLVAGDRVLIKDQSNPAENGVYVTVAGAPIRASDFDTYDENPGSLVTVQEGTTNHDTVWLCTSNAGGTLGTTAIDFSKVKVSPDLPLIISQGGTGQITAPAAFDALKQPATSAYPGVARFATQAEVNAGSDLGVVMPSTLNTRMIAYVGQVIVTHEANTPVHDCRLDWVSSTIIRLNRYGGSRITCNGVHATIPAAGVDLAWAGWGMAVLYIYAYEPGGNGTGLALGITATGPVTGADGNPILSGDARYTLVGMILGGQGGFVQGGQAGFVQGGIIRGVASYWNRRNWGMQQSYAGLQTGGTSPVGLISAMQFVNWTDESFRVWNSGYGLNNSVSCYNVTDMFLNGTQTNAATISHSIAAGAMFDTATSYDVLTNGTYNTAGLTGWVNGGIGAWYGVCGVSGRG